jgi:phosphomannomutase
MTVTLPRPAAVGRWSPCFSAPTVDPPVAGCGREAGAIRPSGTEPKLKAYLEVVEPVPPGRLGAARQAAAARLDALRAAVSQLLEG